MIRRYRSRDYSPRPSPTPPLDEKDIQLEAEWSWETLIKMGGRPTRPILYDITRETKIVNGYIYFETKTVANMAHTSMIATVSTGRWSWSGSVKN